MVIFGVKVTAGNSRMKEGQQFGSRKRIESLRRTWRWMYPASTGNQGILGTFHFPNSRSDVPLIPYYCWTQLQNVVILFTQYTGMLSPRFYINFQERK